MSDVVETGFLILGGAAAYVGLATGAIAGVILLGVAVIRKARRK